MNDAAAHTGSRDELVADCAQALVDAFADYNAEFRAITQRAPAALRGPRLARQPEGRGRAHRPLRPLRRRHRRADASPARRRRRASARSGRAIKRRFAEIIDPLPDNEFTKTFFSSVTRRTFGTVGVDAAVEFIALDLDPLGQRHIRTSRPSIYVNRGSPELLIEELLADFRFRTPYRDFDRSVRTRHRRGQGLARARAASGAAVETLEVIKEVFYQMTRAYLVGRIGGRGWTLPFVHRAAEHRARRAGRCGDARRKHGQRAVQLHALVLPRRPRARRRGRRSS